MFMHDFLRFVIVSFVFVSAVSCLVSVRDMRASAVVADPCVRLSCCPIRVCLGRHTGLPLRLRKASCRRGGGVICIGWKAMAAGRLSAVFQVAAFRAAGCRLSRREKPHVAPRNVAFRAVESRGGRWPWPRARRRGRKKSSPRRCAPRGARWFVVACGRLASVPCRHVFTLLQPSFRLRCRRPWPACRACRRRCPRLHRCRRWCKPSLCRQRSP